MLALRESKKNIGDWEYWMNWSLNDNLLLQKKQNMNSKIKAWPMLIYVKYRFYYATVIFSWVILQYMYSVNRVKNCIKSDTIHKKIIEFVAMILVLILNMFYIQILVKSERYLEKKIPSFLTSPVFAISVIADFLMILRHSLTIFSQISH